jgi:hypothetical protein
MHSPRSLHDRASDRRGRRGAKHHQGERRHLLDGHLSSRDIDVTLYGPATIKSVANATGTLRLRDLSLEALGCNRPSLIMSKPVLDARRVAVVISPNANTQSVNIQKCDATFRQVLITATAFGTGVTVSSTSFVADGLRVTGGRYGISLADAGAAAQITNSVFSDHEYGAISFQSSAGPSAVSFSTFYNTTWTCGDGNVIVESRNNIFVNASVGAPQDTVTGTQCSHNFDLITPQVTNLRGANNVFGIDPQFVDPTTRDFHLKMGSPAIDAADPSATESHDFDLRLRPQGSSRDVGAFEFTDQP